MFSRSKVQAVTGLVPLVAKSYSVPLRKIAFKLIHQIAFNIKTDSLRASQITFLMANISASIARSISKFFFGLTFVK